MSAEAPLEVFYRVTRGEVGDAYFVSSGALAVVEVVSKDALMLASRVPTSIGILGAQVLDQKPG